MQRSIIQRVRNEGQKTNKGDSRLRHVRGLRTAKEAAYIIITVGRWARHSIGSANEGSVIITHDLTLSCSCKDLYCNRSPFVHSSSNPNLVCGNPIT